MSLNDTSNSTSLSVHSCYMTYIVISPSESYVINSAFGCIVNIILAVVCTLLNALVVCIYWKTPKLWDTVSYFMIMILSFIDMFLGIIVHPLHVVNAIAEMTASSKCFYKMSYQTSAVVLSAMSCLTLFVMNVERYLSILHPFFHLTRVTKRGCLLFSILLWIVGLAAGIMPFYEIDIQTIAMVFSLVLLSATFYIYISIYCAARKAKSRAPARMGKTSNTLTDVSTATATEQEVYVPLTEIGKKAMFQESGEVGTFLETESPTSSTTERQAVSPTSKKTVSFMHNLQLAKMYLLVVFSTVLLNLPNAVVLAMFPNRITHLNAIVQGKIWTLTLLAASSTVNSLIFFWANRHLRNEGLNICRRILNRWPA